MTLHSAPNVDRPHAAVVAERLRALTGGLGHLLTVRDVATRLSVSTATVYDLVSRGELPCVRISNAIRVHPEDVAALIERP
jgi:excisionase family DNA binding protein